MSTEFYWIAVAAVLITASARLTRLAIIDDFPPVKYLRDRYIVAMDATPRRRGWQLLALCGYCFSFWATLVVTLWGYLAGIFDGPHHTASETVWWLLFGVLGASYLAVILVAHDGDVNGEDE